MRLNREARQIKKFADRVREDAVQQSLRVVAQSGLELAGAQDLAEVAPHTRWDGTQMHTIYCMDLDPLPDGSNGVELG